MSTDSSTLTVIIDARFFMGLFAPVEQRWNIGGAETQLYYLAEELSKDPSVCVVLLGEEVAPKINNRRLMYQHVMPDVARGVPVLSRFINKYRAQQALRDIDTPAIFFQTQYEPLYLTKIAKARGIKIVRLINGDSLVNGSDLFSAQDHAEIDARIEQADLLIAQNQYQKDCLEQNYGRFSVILDSLLPEPPRGVEKSEDTIIWIGRCSPEKGTHFVGDIARSLPQYRFRVVAAPTTKEREYFDDVAQTMHGIENIEFIDGVSNKIAKEMIAKAALSINTSLSEGMPNTFLEAAVSQTPTLALNVNPEGALSEENGGYCAKGSLADMVSEIEFLMREADVRQEMGERAQRWAMGRWNNQDTIAKYLREFRALAGLPVSHSIATK